MTTTATTPRCFHMTIDQFSYMLDNNPIMFDMVDNFPFTPEQVHQNFENVLTDPRLYSVLLDRSQGNKESKLHRYVRGIETVRMSAGLPENVNGQCYVMVWSNDGDLHVTARFQPHTLRLYLPNHRAVAKWVEWENHKQFMAAELTKAESANC